MHLCKCPPDILFAPQPIPFAELKVLSVLTEQLTYMLVDEKDCDILAMLSETVKCLLNSGGFRFGVDYKKIFLCIRRLCNML